MKIRINIALLAIAFSVSHSSMAKNLYVDWEFGDDAISYNENSQQTPWRTLGRAAWGNSSISLQNAAEAAKSGDVVLVSAGIYETTAATNSRLNPIYNPANSGEPGNPITFKSVEPQGAELRSSQSAGTQPIIGAYGRSHIIWDGFLINEQHVPTRSDTGPVVVWDSSNITLQNLDVTGWDWGWNDNHSGIRVEGSDQVTIKNNTISNYQSISHDQGILFYRSSNIIVENNTIHDVRNGIFLKGSNNGPFAVRKNIIFNAFSGIGIGGVGTSEAQHGADIYQNLFYGGNYSGYSDQAGWAGIWLIGYDLYSPANVRIINNTIVDTAGADGGAILFRNTAGGFDNITIKNNIVSNARHAVTIWDTAVIPETVFSHNNYHQINRAVASAGADLTLEQWQTQYAKDVPGTILSDPMFFDSQNRDYRLNEASPSVNAGIDILDINNNGSTSDAVALGAYQPGDSVTSIGATRSANEIPITPPSAPINLR